MTIVFIDNVVNPSKPGTSGHSDIIWSIAKRLVLLDVKVIIIAPYSTKPLPFYHPNLNVVTFNSLVRPDQNGLTKIRQIMRAIKSLNFVLHPDIVHTSDAFSAGVCSGKLHTPVVFTTSGSIKQRQASKFRLNYGSAIFYRIVSYIASRRTSAIAATSSDMKDWWIRSGAKEEKIKVIKLGTEFVHEQFHKNNLRDRLHILFVGRLVPENNPEHLVDMVNLLEKQGFAYSLTVVGDGELKEPLASGLKSAVAGGNVYFKKTMEPAELVSEYNHADVLVITREAGAPPRTALESLALGRPVLAFCGCGLEDYITDGLNGFLLPCCSMSLLVDKLIWLGTHKEEYESLSNNSRTRALADTDWDQIVLQYLNEYRRIIQKRIC